MARPRDIIRNDDWASKAVDEWACNAIGAGIELQSMHPTLAVKERSKRSGPSGQTKLTPPG